MERAPLGMAQRKATYIYTNTQTKHRSLPAIFDMVSAPESQYTRRNNSINNRGATLWQTVLRHIHRHNSGGRTTLYARRACIYLLVCWYPGRASERASDFHLCGARRSEREATMLHTGSSPPPPHTMGCAMYERVNRYSRTLYPAINYVIDLLLTNINFVCVCERAFRERR
jgi:hypothetical protein